MLTHLSFPGTKGMALNENTVNRLLGNQIFMQTLRHKYAPGFRHMIVEKCGDMNTFDP